MTKAVHNCNHTARGSQGKLSSRCKRVKLYTLAMGVFKLYRQLRPATHAVAVLNLLFFLSLLTACHYPQPDFLQEELSDRSRDSLTYLYERHYTYNSNFEVLSDSVVLERLPIKESYLTLRKNDRVVVAELSVHPTDSVDSIWVKLAHSQEEQGWIREEEFFRSFVPTDSVSQFIYLFSDTHASYFIMFFALFVGVYLLRAFHRKQLQLVYFNDINSLYPLLLCLLMAFSATLYESMQVFTPETWRHFYFNATLSPFKVPFILSLFLLSIWCIVVVALAVIDELFRQLTPAAAVFYLLGLMSACIFCYFFFIITASIYLGHVFLLCFAWLFFKRLRSHKRYRYSCGRCEGKLRQKGICPHCGAINK